LESREVVPKKEEEEKNVHSPSDSHKYLLRYLPENERLRRYMEARNRILAEHQLSGMRLVSPRVQKARECFRMRRSRRREVVAAVKRIDSADPRPFAKGCRELVETLGVTVQPYFSVVRTASGEDRSIIGRLELPVRYKAGHVLPVSIPGTNCVFGVDFWRAIGLAPAVVGKPATRGVKAAEEIHGSQMDH